MYRFLEFQLDPTQGLNRGGEPVALEPQALQLLEFLVRNRDRIVSKQEIIDEIWGGAAITDAALNTRIRSVRKALGDTAASSDYIKTFPKRGFQFVAPVASDDSPERIAQAPKRGFLVAGVLLTLAIAMLSLSIFADRQRLPDTGKPSLAVVQFDNIGDERTGQYFVDGLTDDLIAHLSRNRELFVVSSATMFSYAKDQATPIEIARDLGVGYVVRGSVRRADGQMRISGELIDVDSAETIWAEVFDRQVTDVFDVQDEISRAIAGQLLPEIYESGEARSQEKPTEDMGAWDLYLRGRARQAVFSPEAQQDAVTFAQSAIAADPEFAAAHSLLARALGTIFFFQWSDTPQDTLIAATEAAKRAIELDDQDAQAHAALGYIYRFTGEADPAIANLERAVALNPNDAQIRLELAHTYDWFRMQDRALPEIEMAIRLSPRDPMLQNMYFYQGHILFHLERYEEALDAARQLGAVATSNTWRLFHHLLSAATLAEMGRQDDAQEAVNDALEINPKLSISAMRRQFAGSKNHPENRRIWLASLQKAGVPE
ncbi:MULTISPECIES: winged helix-turn-helix domain-containing protein [unclassified Ruegeria]|uniref:winged helix-turn-helix domain-containing tetratricopeptide repeat protein n=1 Tax=unclassified Ruegeria TaxID=2625375 RepID=UPI001ADA9DE2|nr:MULTISPECIES: winged helix-turn-helix domain-containing protein [unclassified Ruegeria]MBO9410814.1 winged helix-turn-helix domain-containing protein [Ruegeria sp. R8_1]MBO9415015.1 winged helix-turn-helix domain-containing protein [Ruegeria sp. R8_2]